MKSHFLILLLILSITQSTAQVTATMDSIKVYIDCLSKEKYINDKPTPDNYYLSKVKWNASTTILINLTDTASPILRSYAFRLLVERNESEVNKVFLRHLCDTVKVTSYYPGSCLIFPFGVRDYMLRLMSPGDKRNLYRFSKIQFDYYAEMFRQPCDSTRNPSR